MARPFLRYIQFSFMSDTLASPSPESDSTWKRKYKELEAELAVSKNLDPTAAT